MPKFESPNIQDFVKRGLPAWVNRLPRPQRKEIIRKLTTSIGIIEGTRASGAGYLMDRQLREFFSEYNARIFNYGNDHLPSSIAWMAAFLRYDKELNILHLLEERDHLFSFSDFVDFATLEGANLDPYAAARELTPDIVHSYNSYEDPHDLRFTHGNDEFAIGGFSLVRRANEVTVLFVGGEVADLASKQKWIDEGFRSMTPAPGQEMIEIAPGLVARAEPLRGTDDPWKLIGFARFDVEARTLQVRALGRDCGTSFSWVTDDAGIIAQHDDPAGAARQMEQDLARDGVLFEMAKTATLLPKYFDFKLTLVRDETVCTRMGKALESGSAEERCGVSGVPPRERVSYRRVAALRIVRPDVDHVARRFTAPAYCVEVSGFWRQLDPGALGRGPNGEAVEGRTWVRGHLRWRDLPERPIQVLVKSRVALARAAVAADELEKKAATAGSVPATSQSGAPSASSGAAAALPSVSRDEAYRERRRLTARVRYAILQRDDFRCLRCGADAASDRNVRLDVDHKIAVLHGGKTEPENLWTLCSRCNNGKGTALP